MRWIRFAVFILIVTVLQASWVDIIGITNWNIKPDLLLILLVFFAIYCNTTDAIITSFAIGFAADIIGSAMGPQTVSFGIFGTLMAYLHRFIAIRQMPYQSAAIFITGVLAGGLAYFLAFLKGEQGAANIFVVLFGTSAYSAILGPFLFLPTAWWMRIKIQRFGRH